MPIGFAVFDTKFLDLRQIRSVNGGLVTRSYTFEAVPIDRLSDRELALP
jgi:hypothetical protein